MRGITGLNLYCWPPAPFGAPLTRHYSQLSLQLSVMQCEAVVGVKLTQITCSCPTLTYFTYRTQYLEI